MSGILENIKFMLRRTRCLRSSVAEAGKRVSSASNATRPSPVSCAESVETHREDAPEVLYAEPELRESTGHHIRHNT
jgi:hypothetical protein